jgi:cold shock CspA family protein
MLIYFCLCLCACVCVCVCQLVSTHMHTYVLFFKMVCSVASTFPSSVEFSTHVRVHFSAVGRAGRSTILHGGHVENDCERGTLCAALAHASTHALDICHTACLDARYGHVGGLFGTLNWVGCARIEDFLGLRDHDFHVTLPPRRLYPVLSPSVSSFFHSPTA